MTNISSFYRFIILSFYQNISTYSGVSMFEGLQATGAHRSNKPHISWESWGYCVCEWSIWKWLNSNIDHPKASIKWWNDKMCVSKTWINSNREVVRDSHIERNRKEDIRNVYDLYFQRYLLKTWKSDPY